MARRQRARCDRVDVIGNRFPEYLDGRLGAALDHVECVREHAVLEVGVARLSERSSEREVAEEPAWRSGTFDLGADRTEGDGSDPGGFEDMGEHTHGARAQRSDRGEHHHIDAVGK